MWNSSLNLANSETPPYLEVTIASSVPFHFHKCSLHSWEFLLLSSLPQQIDDTWRTPRSVLLPWAPSKGSFKGNGAHLENHQRFSGQNTFCLAELKGASLNRISLYLQWQSHLHRAPAVQGLCVHCAHREINLILSNRTLDFSPAIEILTYQGWPILAQFQHLVWFQMPLTLNSKYYGWNLSSAFTVPVGLSRNVLLGLNLDLIEKKHFWLLLH